MADSAAQVRPDPRDWQPMRPYRGRRSFDIRDAILEPLWSGVRVIAHVSAHVSAVAGDAEPPQVALVEDLGADVAGELPGLAEAVGRSVMALDAVIDGVISRQVGLDGVGAAPIPEMRSRPGMLMRSNVDLDVVPRGAVVGPSAAADGFIAFDLLRVDGISLLDVPLLERKRLLESVVRPSLLVRSSPHVRPPIESWIATWKAMGLRGGILKAANSRYVPGEDSIEWRIVEHLGRQR
jgi:bifunctional non-homologous end joining protein LigD